MSLPRVHAPYLRILAALSVASSASACVMNSAPEAAVLEEDTLPAASVKPTCPSGGCHPQTSPAGTVLIDPIAPTVRAVAASELADPGAAAK